jgi:hypothetical protein
MEVSPFAFAAKRNLKKRNLKFGSSLESVRCLTSERSNIEYLWNLPLRQSLWPKLTPKMSAFGP